MAAGERPVLRLEKRNEIYQNFGQGVDDPSHTDAEKDFFEIFSFSIYMKKITCYC